MRRIETKEELDRAMQALDGKPEKISAADWPGDLTGLDHPGLYSWWVDATGARDLSLALGRIDEGRIYAGQAGEDSSATLGSRVLDNHLAGRIARSTLRRSLAGTLRDALELNLIGDVRLARHSEGELTGWMNRHLLIAVHAVPDRTGLQALERRVLKLLDPPLNLQGMNSCAQRKILSELRDQLASPLSARQAESVQDPVAPSEDEGPRPKKISLHAEIERILRTAGQALTSREIANKVNASDNYRKRDGSAVEATQISARIAGHQRFTRMMDGRIGLAEQKG